ncbi:hypothetical protein TWF506_010798 [Arthrobotrys conoides]|uniref:Uncharacterized protein n=1 Tax=Arthrobotrys conoides TaxID=74498 RepID=A0AAN8N9D8_9PEZI
MPQDITLGEWCTYFLRTILPWLMIITFPAVVLYNFSILEIAETETYPPTESSESAPEDPWFGFDEGAFDEEGAFEIVRNDRFRQETVDKLADMKRVSDLYYKSPEQKRAEEMEEEMERLVTEAPDSEDGGIGDRVKKRRGSPEKSHENVEGSPVAKKRGRPPKN